eukprot:216266_1
MNLRKNSRIQQAPTMDNTTSYTSSALRSIPSSVEFTNGRQPESYLSSQMRMRSSPPSAPIPIKKRRPSPQELEEDVHSANCSSHYDWATWRMYERITTARRIRASSRTGDRRSSVVDVDSQEDQAVVINDDDAYFRPIAHSQSLRNPAVEDSRHGRNLSIVEDFADDGVFVLDCM